MDEIKNVAEAIINGLECQGWIVDRTEKLDDGRTVVVAHDDYDFKMVVEIPAEAEKAIQI